MIRIPEDLFLHKPYAVLDGIWPQAQVAILRERVQARIARGELRQAGVGRDQNRQTRSDIRSDSHVWLDPEGDRDFADLFSELQQLGESLRGTLRLPLTSLEFQVAQYAPGAFYSRHADTLRSAALANVRSRRFVSAVIYLNADWAESDGGELCLYASERGPCVEKILPVENRLVLFESDIWHEVLPATRERLSISGWFKSAGALD